MSRYMFRLTSSTPKSRRCQLDAGKFLQGTSKEDDQAADDKDGKGGKKRGSNKTTGTANRKRKSRGEKRGREKDEARLPQSAGPEMKRRMQRRLTMQMRMQVRIWKVMKTTRT